MAFLRSLIVAAPLVAAISGVGFAQEIRLRNPNGFNEEWRSEAQISSGLVVGVMGVAPATAQRPSAAAMIPAGWKDLCVRMLSASGLYEAENNYTVADWSGTGAAGIELASPRPDDLGRLRAEEMAILVSEGACGREVVEFGVAFWNSAPTGPPERIDVLVNSFRAEEVFYYLGNATKPTDCRRLAAPGQTEFDARCPIPWEEVRGDSLSLEIYRVRGREIDEPLFVTVRLGPTG